MREILFKAKRKDNGKWVEGSLISTEGGKRFILHSKTILFAPRNRNTICSAECYEIEPDTICQYTGLTDKNGRKIWENDICIIKDRILDEYGYFVCKWDIDAARCILKGIFTVDFYGINATDVEVVGNVFDNADLLEVK